MPCLLASAWTVCGTTFGPQLSFSWKQPPTRFALSCSLTADHPPRRLGFYSSSQRNVRANTSFSFLEKHHHTADLCKNKEPMPGTPAGREAILAPRDHYVTYQRIRPKPGLSGAPPDFASSFDGPLTYRRRPHSRAKCGDIDTSLALGLALWRLY